MELYVWLLPLLFIFHDMEEIIGFIPWYQKNKKMLDQKYPKISSVYKGTSTEGFAFAVFEILILCIGICVISIFTKWYGLWLGSLIGCTLHFVIHIIQALIIKKYIPALLTSIISLPVGCIVIYNSLKITNYPICSVVTYSIIGMIIILLNLKFAHIIMKKFTIWQSHSFFKKMWNR